MPRVSVVMPAYNDQRYVAETIQSVLAQTYQDFQFIITNNGSTDETGNIIKTFTDPRIKLLTLEKNRGHCGGMNNSIVFYQMSEFYHRESATGVRWNDPLFGIEWPSTTSRIISEKDQSYPDFN